jgi:transcription elongation factor GreA
MLHPDDAVPASASPRLMRAEFDALVMELHELRSRYQHELADRLRDARVSLGCTVRVAGDAGATAGYRLVGRRGEVSTRHEVSSGSPVGRALLGARPGQRVRVELPGGRERALGHGAAPPCEG